MDHGADSFAAVLAVFCIFGLPIVWGIASRWMAHQERMAMIARGMTPPPDMGGRGWGRRGMYGPGPVPGTPPQGAPYSYDYAQWQASRMLHKGITVGMIGLAMTIGLSFIDGMEGRPGPWLLGGLIPMFIGIAQIVIALMSGATVPFGRAVPPPPPGQAGPVGGSYEQPQAPRDVTPGAYAWRPGPTTELKKPPSPPDTR